MSVESESQIVVVAAPVDRQESFEVGRIVQLDEVVINRIAAGEVVVRPANALKELLENSLDAGSSHIVVTTKAGGLKTLRIEDDGHGIRAEDMGILCERFTTSKLRKYEDLSSIGTFGFRGEALASISHVAHVTVTTMMAGDSTARVASYTDGKLRAPPRPCAGTRGTTLVVEDLFYNNTTRRQALNKDSVEHSRILEVMQRYAIHNPTVSFACRKVGCTSADMHSPGGPSTTSADVVGVIQGRALSKELFPFEIESDDLKFKCHGLASGPNWTSRTSSLVLFINNRLVECGSMKRAVDAVYGPVLPRHQHPWVYLSLDLDPATIDVNVHPTKSEVQFLHENFIAEKVQEALSVHLQQNGATRNFQADLPLFSKPKVPKPELPADEAGSSTQATQADQWTLGEKKVVVQNPVRIRADHRQLSLDSVWRGSQSNLDLVAVECGDDAVAEAAPEDDACRIAYEDAQQLTSLNELKQAVSLAEDLKVTKALGQSVYVGAVSREVAVLQCGSTLSVANLARLARECAYQRLLRSFGGVGTIILKEPLPLRDLLHLGVRDPSSGYDPESHPHVDVEELVGRLAAMLDDKAELLLEYYSLEISEGMLRKLPNALGVSSAEGLVFDELPLFLVRLCGEVDWTEEKAAFEGICRCIADFSVEALLPNEADAAAATTAPRDRLSEESDAINAAVAAGDFEDVVAAAAAASAAMSRKRARTGAPPRALEELRWLHDAVRRDGACQWPGEFARDGTVLDLVSLEQLYKIFERC